MAPLNEFKWRMLRRVLKKKRFSYEEIRNGNRHDRDHFDWLLSNGFFTAVGNGSYEMTEKGREAADLGLYDDGTQVAGSSR